jgi:uncharacterized membrane protein
MPQNRSPARRAAPSLLSPARWVRLDGSTLLTLGLVGVGAAVVEAALVPGLAIGAATLLAANALPKRRRASPARGKLAQRLKETRRPAPFHIGQAAAKTISFRVVVTSLDFSWNYLLLGELAAAAGLSAISLVAGPIFYFLHETLWNRYGGTALREIGWQEGPTPALASQFGSPAPRGRFTPDRALAKTITFRIMATTTEFTTNYLVVRDVGMAAALSAWGLVLGPFVYYGHERVWERIGRTPESPAPNSALPAPASA